jgi:GT2 family glycosyltransferase
LTHGRFCLFFKREALQKISLFDDKAEPGQFNADAVCWKVRQAGYRCVCCRELLIHHFGSRLAVRS